MATTVSGCLQGPVVRRPQNARLGEDNQKEKVVLDV
jgi:hypothetical protein